MRSVSHWTCTSTLESPAHLCIRRPEHTHMVHISRSEQPPPSPRTRICGVSYRSRILKRNYAPARMSVRGRNARTVACPRSQEHILFGESVRTWLALLCTTTSFIIALLNARDNRRTNHNRRRAHYIRFKTIARGSLWRRKLQKEQRAEPATLRSRPATTCTWRSTIAKQLYSVRADSLARARLRAPHSPPPAQPPAGLSRPPPTSRATRCLTVCRQARVRRGGSTGRLLYPRLSTVDRDSERNSTLRPQRTILKTAKPIRIA